MKTVTVLMSTYNGEKYIREQIESVLAQKEVNVRILIRDDGSNDSTLDILQEYVKSGKISLIKGNNIGWRSSFMELVYTSPESDYYSFCDQDDIWLPGKLKAAIDTLSKNQEDNIPLLYGSNLFFFKNGKKCGTLNLNSNFSKHTCLVRALTCGCTLVFNSSLCSILKNYKPNKIEAHDSWVFIVAMFLGKVIFDPNAYILYRQHEDNQIGAKRSFSERLKRGIQTLCSLGKENGKSCQAREFLRVFNDLLTDEDRRIVEKFGYYQKNVYSKMGLIFDNRYSTGRFFSDISLKIKIFTNSI